MLAPYRKEAGLQPRKPSYPNWDGSDGHVGGHYRAKLVGKDVKTVCFF